MGLDPDQAMTSAVLRYSRITHEEQEEDNPPSPTTGEMHATGSSRCSEK